MSGGGGGKWAKWAQQQQGHSAALAAAAANQQQRSSAGEGADVGRLRAEFAERIHTIREVACAQQLISLFIIITVVWLLQARINGAWDLFHEEKKWILDKAVTPVHRALLATCILATAVAPPPPPHRSRLFRGRVRKVRRRAPPDGDSWMAG
jgi:hypothetical protein